MYGEYDEEYYCIRAIFEEDQKLFTTNFIYDEYILPEGSFIDELEYLGEKISESEFNKIWKNSLEAFLAEWNEIKDRYKIGKKIEAKIICIYPQGIICDIGEKYHGITNYNECKIKYGTKYLYPKNKMEMEIIGYDENNMWVELK